MRFFLPAVLPCLLSAATACAPECEREIRQTAMSPGGSHVATVFVENCHATSPFVTTVSIRPAEKELDPDDYVFAAKGSVGVAVAWVSDDAIVIHTDATEVFRRTDRWRGVSVRYARPDRNQEPP